MTDRCGGFRFALSKKGEIICFGRMATLGVRFETAKAPLGGRFKTAPDLKLWPSISDFIAAQTIKVDTVEQAIDMVNLVNILREGVKSGVRDPDSWSLHAKKKRNGELALWFVTIGFNGPPGTSIMLQPCYEVNVDKGGGFKEVSRIANQHPFDHEGTLLPPNRVKM